MELSEPVTALCIRANDIVADFVNAAKTGEDPGADYGAEERAQQLNVKEKALQGSFASRPRPTVSGLKTPEEFQEDPLLPTD